jgi:hypothetical protein
MRRVRPPFVPQSDVYWDGIESTVLAYFATVPVDIEVPRWVALRHF